MQSMTGFGRGSHNNEEFSVNVEVASVNRKQLEVIANLPKGLPSLEQKVREAAANQVTRGRIQFSIQIDYTASSTPASAKIDEAAVKSFENGFTALSKIIGRDLTPTASDYLRQGNLIEFETTKQIDPETYWEALQPAISEALTALVQMRADEGQHLRNDFTGRMKKLQEFTEQIEEIAKTRPEMHRKLLEKRLSEIGLDLKSDNDRLAKEIALFADRCDITEEITRLDAHFVKFDEYLSSSEPSGRPLDFLCQELSREFNTIGSKANDAKIAQLVVQSKTELEKVREQVQNVE